MIRRPHALGLVLAAALSFGSATAFADIAPGPGFVEKCTIASQQQATERCELCGDAYHGDMEACVNKYKGSAFAKRCQTSGASTWDELWCRPLESTEKPSPGPAAPAATTGGSPQSAPATTTGESAPPAPAGGCASCSLGAPNDRAAFLALFAVTALAGLAFARKRR